MRGFEEVSQLSLNSSLERGLDWLQIRNFKFTGPDGVEYMWDLGILGMSSPKVGLANLLAGILGTERGSRFEVGHWHGQE